MSLESSSSMIGPVEVIERALVDDTGAVPLGYSANAIVLSRVDHPYQQHVCGKLLSVFTPVNLLGVAIKHDPSYYKRVTERHMAVEPTRLGIVDVGAMEASDDPAVKTVSNAGDLTGLGMNVMHFIKRWAATEEPTVVCFDSLTPLLQYSDVDRVYRFLDVTTQRLRQVSAVSHVHVDAKAHDDRTLHQLMSAFDAIAEPDGEEAAEPESWSVRPT